MTKFSEIPIDEFPMGYVDYTRLQTEIGSIAARFSDLATPDGARVAKHIEKAQAVLSETWELIREIERREEAG